MQKLRKVFNQISDFGVARDYDECGDGELYVKLWFNCEEKVETAYALKDFVSELIETAGEDIGLERFKRADITIFS